MLIEGATVDLVVENERLHAELRAQTEELRRSRARLVAAGDAERRRLERDLHDGAQSRFVATALHLRLAQAKAPPGSEVAAMLDEAIGDLMIGIDELRELARGLHPAVLTERGLVAALESLARRAPLDVEVRAALPRRLPPAVETPAYFAASEALANVVKHARADHATIDVGLAGGRLVIEVRDDGRGGAAVGAGSGLRGLEDRIGALDGRVAIHSPVGGGTHVRIEVPFASPAVAAAAGAEAAAPGSGAGATVIPFRCERFRRRE